MFNFQSSADKNKTHLQSSVEATAKSLENGNKEVDNTEGICSTYNVNIVELMEKENFISNGFVGFQFRKVQKQPREVFCKKRCS